jgi:hypothetical protein
VQAGERPVGLARVVLRVEAGDRGVVGEVVHREHRPRPLGLRRQEPAELAQELVVPRVARVEPPLDETGREQGRCPGRGDAAVSHGGPAVPVDEVVERPLQAPVGAVLSPGDAGGGGLVQAHGHPRVADHVVLERHVVGPGVVEVEPRAVGILVALEPVHRLGGGLPQFARRHRGTPLGRRHHAEHADGGDAEDETRPAEPPPW